MIEIMSVGLDDRVLGLRVKGPIERTDVDAVAVAFERKLQRHKPLRIYAEVDAIGSISPAALMEDLRLSLRHFRDVEREAIVSDESWLTLLARAGDLLPGIEVRSYPWSEKAQALEWINA
jgi:hypothetical protein